LILSTTLIAKKYTHEHEWVEVENGVATIGITNHAQEALGEIVYVEAAELKYVEQGGTCVFSMFNLTVCRLLHTAPTSSLPCLFSHPLTKEGVE
jgi:hypothetical protein